jgi:hypothetical protein
MEWLGGAALRAFAATLGPMAPQIGMTDADEIELAQSLQIADFRQEKQCVHQQIDLLRGHVLGCRPEFRGIQPDRLGYG